MVIWLISQSQLIQPSFPEQPCAGKSLLSLCVYMCMNCHKLTVKMFWLSVCVPSALVKLLFIFGDESGSDRSLTE